MTTISFSDSDDMSASSVSKKCLLEKMDLIETPSSFIMKLDAPGIQMKDIIVHYRVGINFSLKEQLMISVYVNRTLDQRNFSLAERESGRFSRHILTPPGINTDVEPKYSITDGVITIFVTKLEIDLQFDVRSSPYPLTDVYDFPNEQVYSMDLPGLNKENIKLEIVNTTIGGRILPELRITGKWERSFDGAILHSGNRPSHSFCRGYLLPESVNGVKMENLHWEMQDGVLTLVLPKKDKVSKRARTTAPTPTATTTGTATPTEQ